MKPVANPRLADYLLVGFASAGVLSFEIILLRVFSFSQWHHFASLAVALALLGFGISGTLLTFLGHRVIAWGDRLFMGGLLLGAGGMMAAFLMPRWIHVRPLFALLDSGELLKLVLLDFVALVPFLGLAISIGQVFVRWPAATPRLYAANLLGSGAGCLLPVLLLSFLPLERALLLIPLLLLLAAAAFGIGWRRAPLLGIGALGGLCLLVAWFIGGIRPLPLSDFKQLAYLLDLPDARVLSREPGLIADITVIRSEGIRTGRGLSVQWTEPVPPVDAAVLEADTVIPLWRPGEMAKSAEAARASLMALPFHLRPQGNLAVLGASDWLLPAVTMNRDTVLVEPHPGLLELYEQRDMYNGAGKVQATPRQFLESTAQSFSLVVLAGASLGADPVDVDYLLTEEGMHACFSVLAADGVIAIPLKLSYPPRHAIRLLELLRSVLLNAGKQAPGGHLAMVRSMEEGLFLVSREPLAEEDLRLIRTICEEWSFDLSILPGLQLAETNRYHMLERPVYHEAARALLMDEARLPEEADWFSREIPSDEQPHFWKSMRWSMLPLLINELGRNGLVWLDWSILVSVVKWLFAGILAGVFILLPLGRLPVGKVDFGRWAVVIFFGSLGLGFLMLELVIFQRSILFLGHPVVTAALVFSTFLTGAGLGSLTTPRVAGKAAVQKIFLPILGMILLCWGILYWMGTVFLTLPMPVRFLILGTLFLSLSFLLGRAFPWGLSQLQRSGRHISWAWGINGFASVLAAPMAVLCAVHFGQNLVWLLGMGCYLVATLTVRQQA